MEVTCSFRHQSFAFKDRNNQSQAGYTCIVKNIVLNKNSGIVIDGQHENLKSCQDVIGLMIDRIPSIDKFPKGFGYIFPNLIYIQIRRCGLTMLSAEDFIDVSHLRGLWVPENHIVALKKDVFTNVQGLQYLCFYRNKLKYIHKDVLAPLKNLRAANFGENTCIDFNYTGEEGGYEKLIIEIATKCTPAPPVCTNSPNNADDQIEKRIKALESIVKLQSKNIANLEMRLKKIEQS
jgi:Leucine rich repeat